jgi:hypothetical protein
VLCLLFLIAYVVCEGGGLFFFALKQIGLWIIGFGIEGGGKFY